MMEWRNIYRLMILFHRMMNSISSNGEIVFIECLCWLVSAFLLARKAVIACTPTCKHCCRICVLAVMLPLDITASVQSFSWFLIFKGRRIQGRHKPLFLDTWISKFDSPFCVLTVYPAHLHDADVMHVIEWRILSELMCFTESRKLVSELYL